MKEILFTIYHFTATIADVFTWLFRKTTNENINQFQSIKRILNAAT